MSRFLRLAFGIGLLAAIVIYYGFEEVFRQLVLFDWRWGVLAIILIIISTLLGSLNTYLFLRSEKRISLLPFIPIYWVSWAFGLVFPGQIGDMVSLAALLKRRGIDFHISVSRTFVDKVISLLVIMLFSLTAVFFYLQLTLGEISTDIPIVIITGAGILLTGIVIARKQVLRIFSPEKDGWLGFVGHIVAEIVVTVRRYPGVVALNFLLTCVKVFLIGLSYWAVFSAYATHDVPVMNVVFLAAASSIVAYVPVSFNGIGTVELAGIYLFTSVGLDESLIISAYLALRLLVMITAWMPSACMLIFMPKKNA